MITEKHKIAIAAKLQAVKDAEIAYQSYVQAVADLVELDTTKKWTFNVQTLEFEEITEK
jgi:hypothetical protein